MLQAAQHNMASWKASAHVSLLVSRNVLQAVLRLLSDSSLWLTVCHVTLLYHIPSDYAA
jgi:hypothetical protein